MTHDDGDHDPDELRLLAMFEHPHQADAIARLTDDDLQSVIDEHEDQ